MTKPVKRNFSFFSGDQRFGLTGVRSPAARACIAFVFRKMIGTGGGSTVLDGLHHEASRSPARVGSGGVCWQSPIFYALPVGKAVALARPRGHGKRPQAVRQALSWLPRAVTGEATAQGASATGP